MKTISNYGRNKYNFAFFGLIICMIHLFVIYKYNDEIVKNLLSRPNKDFVNLYDLLRVSIKAAQNGGVEVVSATNLSIETRNKTTRKGALYETIDADVNSYCAMLDTISASFPKIQIISRGDDTDCVERRNSSTPQRLPLNGNQELEEYARIEDVAIWIEPLDAPEEYKCIT